MQLTDYHAKYFAHELTRRFPPDSVEKLTGALVDAQDEVDRHRDSLIASIEGKLAQRITSTVLFSVWWGLR